MIIEIDEAALTEGFLHSIEVPGIRPVVALEQLIAQQIGVAVIKVLGVRLIKPPVVRIYADYNQNKWASIQQFASDGYHTWYPEIKFATKPGDAIDSVFVRGSRCAVDPATYRNVEEQKFKFRVDNLKNQTNHHLKAKTIRVHADFFREIAVLMATRPPLEQPYVANPKPQLRDGQNEYNTSMDKFVSFDHLLSGERVFCSCAKSAHGVIRVHAESVRHKYIEDSWPNHAIRFLLNPKYVEDICHLCVAKTHGIDAVSHRYGDDMQEFVAPYAYQLVKGGGIDERTAKAEVQQQLGLSKWLREAEMYKLVKHLFPDEIVEREASPLWLGRQRLDVYLPNINLALEYQGQQHYYPVGVFGGEKALARTIERDMLKKRLCDENAVELVYVRFSDPLTEASLRHRLRRFLKRPGKAVP